MKRALIAAALAAAAAAFVALFFFLGRPPAGPVEPAWDRTTCAHCRMHLSEPAFAAQLQAESGEVHFFDDPGCLFSWRGEHGGPGRVFFRLAGDGGWREEREVAFLPGGESPMGWGLAAVAAGTPGAIPAAEAARRVLEGSHSTAEPAHGGASR